MGKALRIIGSLFFSGWCEHLMGCRSGPAMTAPKTAVGECGSQAKQPVYGRVVTRVAPMVI